jgi:hypothetical protein
VSCIVSQADAVRALKCIHETFGLAGKEVVNVPA